MSRKRSNSTRDETIILRSNPKKLKTTFVVGDKVQAQWKDRRWYAAKVTKVNPNDGSFTVKFIEDGIVREGLKTDQIRYAVKQETLDLFSRKNSEAETSDEEESESESEENTSDEENSSIISRKKTGRNDFVTMDYPASPSKLRPSPSSRNSPAKPQLRSGNNETPTRNLRSAHNDNSPKSTKTKNTRQSVAKKAIKKKGAQSNATSPSKPQRELRSASKKEAQMINSDSEEDDNEDDDVNESDEEYEGKEMPEEETRGRKRKSQFTQDRIFIFNVTIPAERALKPYTLKSGITPALYEKYIVPLLKELS